ncbi:MAG: hypothetical protein WCI22_08695 [Actinomycetota bacterium]
MTTRTRRQLVAGCLAHLCVLRCSCVEFHRSAFKRGVDVVAISHAVEHCLVVVDLDRDTDPPRVLAIGPDLAGRLLEIIWLELGEERVIVIHAMPLRPTFYDLLPHGDTHD